MSTQRILTRNLIVHSDFNIGFGTESQTRGDTEAVEQKVELIWIFRSIDEIRALNYSKYTRVSLHVDNALVIEYWFDPASAAVDDGDEVLAPVPPIALGRWRRIHPTPATATSTELNDISHSINTGLAKKAGYRVFNTTTNKPVWAVAIGAAAVWVDADGTTTHTPV